MQVKRILNFTEEELNILIKAGKLLGSIRDELANFDELSPEANELVEALKQVVSEINK